MSSHSREVRKIFITFHSYRILVNVTFTEFWPFQGLTRLFLGVGGENQTAICQKLKKCFGQSVVVFFQFQCTFAFAGIVRIILRHL